MDKGKFEKLNKFHVIFLAQNIIIGIGLFSLPSDLSEAGNNMWLVPSILGILANLILIPLILLCKRYPEDSIFQMTEKIVGKGFGKIINFFLLLYGIVQVAVVLQGYVRLVQSITLPNHTIVPTTIAIMLVLICIVYGGIKSIARFCMFAFFITIWMVYFTKWAFQTGDWFHVVPTFEIDTSAWALSLHNGAQSMFGFGIIVLYYPYIINKKKAFLHTSIGIWISVVVYTLITLASVVYFSAWQQNHVLYPILNLYQAVQLNFVERIENFGVSLWVFLVLSTTAAYLWLAKKGMDALFSQHKNKDWHLYVVSFLSAFLFLGPIPNKIQNIVFEEMSVYYGYLFFLLPIFLLLIDLMKRRRGSHK
ncbi:GerAB/ArcD/ProY family transporter [Bacillus suaedae]|uniref:GerAB/ArcD/ProY family transporter n=1 Tax=Halalkalibacter suaedae TaxID=2822140 RepID=A0A940WPN3_9BACI|nr:GerAB/ArcD/ProY family transporter [Bacillus suaedae]MBP3950359.1 GerAB/ArcD/ProY family transporter [Bacillus suaedae]